MRKLAELFRDAGTGLLSHTKLWANVGYLVMVVAFLRQVWVHELTVDLLMWFGAIFTGSAMASKFLSLKYGRSEPTAGDVIKAGGND